MTPVPETRHHVGASLVVAALALALTVSGAVAAFRAAPLRQGNNVIAANVVRQFFAATDSKNLSAIGLLLNDGDFKLTISDHECHVNLSRSEALDYLNSSSVWYTLMQRSLQEMIQVGDRFFGSFIDAGFIPPGLPTHHWSFLSNSVVDGIVTEDDKLSMLHLQMNFSSPFGDAATTVMRRVFDGICSANLTEVAQFFAQDAVIVKNLQINNGAPQVQVQPVADWLAELKVMFVTQEHCEVLWGPIVAGCGFASAGCTLIRDSVNSTQQEIAHGFARFDFAASTKSPVGWAATKMETVTLVAVPTTP